MTTGTCSGSFDVLPRWRLERRRRGAWRGIRARRLELAGHDELLRRPPTDHDSVGGRKERQSRRAIEVSGAGMSHT